jgi:sRNA-binding protein
MYQVALAAGGYRHNLDGTVAGEVSAEHMTCAASALAHMDAKAAEAAAKVRAEQRAAREAEKARVRAEREARPTPASDGAKGPAPYHKATPQIIVPRAPQPVEPVPPKRLGLAGLKLAAQERRRAAQEGGKRVTADTMATT